MKKNLFKVLCFICALTMVSTNTFAQKKRAATKRTAAAKKNANSKATANQGNASQADSLSAAQNGNALSAAQGGTDSLPITKTKKSLRTDVAVDAINLDNKEKTPLTYEHLRADDAIYRHKIWREIDTREKLNLPFRYAADEDNGNQRFINILLKAIQDKENPVTVFDPIDDRFTTPLTVSQVSKLLGGGGDSVPIYGQNSTIVRYDWKPREVNLDSIYKFKIKEEVIFDKESSRLFWRILGIAPVRNVYSSTGDLIGQTDVFWVYYPDMRPIFAKYEIYNGKNYVQE